jgi:hypothetical protein
VQECEPPLAIGEGSRMPMTHLCLSFLCFTICLAFFCGIRCIRLAAHAHFSLQRAAFAAVTPALGRIGAWL